MPLHGFGTSFVWDGATVATLTNIGGVNVTADVVDVSSHQSANAYKEFIAGMLDGGEIPLEGFYDFSDTTGQQAMLTDMEARTSKTASIAFPSASGSAFSFSAIMTSWKVGDLVIDGAIPFTATVKITGQPSFTVATSAGLTTPFFAISESAVIIPTPAQASLVYTASVLTGITSVTLTPTASAGVITVDGNIVVSGVASSAITLGGAGSNTIVTVIVTETDKAPVTYIITVIRA